jgi:hypothetical protein
VPAISHFDAAVGEAGDFLDLKPLTVVVAGHHASAGSSKVDGQMSFASIFHSRNAF